MDVDISNELHDCDVYSCEDDSESSGSDSEIPMEIDLLNQSDDPNDGVESLMDLDTSFDESLSDPIEGDQEHLEIHDVEMQMGSSNELTPEELERYYRDFEENMEATDKAALEIAQLDSDDLYESD